mgnify:CR=1 FL=1
MLRLLVLVLSLLLGACGVPPNPVTSACSSNAECSGGLQCMPLSGCRQDLDENDVADIVDACEAAGGHSCTYDSNPLYKCLAQEGVLFCDRDVNGNGHPDLVDLGMYPDDDCGSCEMGASDFVGCNPYCFTIQGERTTIPTGSIGGQTSSGQSGQANNGGGGTTSDTADCTLVNTGAELAPFALNAYDIALSNIGGPGEDFGQVEFYGEADPTGSFDLGSGANANYETCTECVLIIQDAMEDTETFFFQEAGTLSISGDSVVSSGKLTLTLESLRLREVTFSGPEGLTSTPVAGGACLTFSSPLTLSTP